jgi:oxygen-independent coproporphyrinogen-3 oxidase
VLKHGLRYHADSVPTDDVIAQMYSLAIEKLKQAGLEQYEISNFCRAGMESQHNLRYWLRRPYLGVGLDASSMLRKAGFEGVGSVLRATTSDGLKDYLAGHEPVERTWLTLAEQHEEAWFLGLRLNAGVDLSALKCEFGEAVAAPALQTVKELGKAGLVVSDDQMVRLTPRGQLLSNEVFQEFLGITAHKVSI